MNRAVRTFFPLVWSEIAFPDWVYLFHLRSAQIKLKLKLKLNLGFVLFKILSLIQSVLGWSLYFSMECFTLSAHVFEDCSEKHRSFWIDRYLAILQK